MATAVAVNTTRNIVTLQYCETLYDEILIWHQKSYIGVINLGSLSAKKKFFIDSHLEFFSGQWWFLYFQKSKSLGIPMPC